MNRRALQLVVVAVLVAAAFALRGRRVLPPTPEAAVSAFFDAASRGDDKAYVALASGELLKSLLSSRSQLGVGEFQDNLKRSVLGLKGIAVTRGSGAPPGCVALDVELVFADRNERQVVTVTAQAGGWALAEIASARAVKPLVPYGTPVFRK